MKTIVVQSHSSSRIVPWIASCLQSVKDWAERSGFDYRFLGDELFDQIPAWVRDMVGGQTVIATDLARLRLMQQCFREGYDRAIWLDADMLVFAPEHFTVGGGPHAVGREVWVQKEDRGRLKAYRKVHNAYLMATKDDSFLPFYADSAEQMLARAKPPLVPQFIGPKLLTALHNLTGLQVEERAGMLSPLALRGVHDGGGEAHEMTVAGHGEQPAAYNLSASYCGRESDGVLNTPTDYEGVIGKLLESFS